MPRRRGRRRPCPRPGRGPPAARARRERAGRNAIATIQNQLVNLREGLPDLAAQIKERISAPGSRLEAWVIPTDEELLIARDSFRVVVVADSRF